MYIYICIYIGSRVRVNPIQHRGLHSCVDHSYRLFHLPVLQQTDKPRAFKATYSQTVIIQRGHEHTRTGN